MKRRDELPELLAPAGDMSALYAAVLGGADAVYIGGKSFSARAFAKNFDIPDIRSAVRYCHIHNVKLYVALNTLIYDREMADAVNYAGELYRVGVDALICADLGVIREIRRAVPELEIHASTQMSIHNSHGADEAARLGISRVVLARELSLNDIRATVNSSSPECEIFLHGALCVCHSGQCLLSSMVGGRSGNRGECAQPCRLPYNGKYPLSLRDLSLAEHIPELIDSGVASLKIEGRMKSAEYVYRVTSIYRRLLDSRRSADKEECAELARIFSRGGFTDGYLTGRLTENMTGVRSDADKQSSRSVSGPAIEAQRVAVRARVIIKRGVPSRLILYLGDRSFEAIGDIPTDAISSPLTDTGVKERLCKMGTTNLSLSDADIICEIDEGLNLSPSAINALRRDAAELAECCDRRLTVTEELEYRPKPPKKAPPLKTALFFDPAAFSEHEKKYKGSFFDIKFLPLFSEELLTHGGKDVGAYIPPVITECELDAVKSRLKTIKNKGVLYALVGNIGHFSIIKDAGLIPIGDARLNVTNSSSREYYDTLGAAELILSPELTLPMARDIGGGEIIYGRLPLMLTERCFIRESFGCESCAKAPALTDRQGARFPIIREWQHRNIILNSVKTYMLDKQDELERQSISHTHFIFSDEGAEEIASTVHAFKHRTPSKEKNIRRIGSLTAAKKGSTAKGEAGSNPPASKKENTSNSPSSKKGISAKQPTAKKAGGTIQRSFKKGGRSSAQPADKRISKNQISKKRK